MAVNVDKLRGKMVEMRKTQEEVASAIGIDRATFARKLKANGSKFTIGEVQRIMAAVPLSKADAVDIFLS